MRRCVTYEENVDSSPDKSKDGSGEHEVVRVLALKKCGSLI